VSTDDLVLQLNDLEALAKKLLAGVQEIRQSLAADLSGDENTAAALTVLRDISDDQLKLVGVFAERGVKIAESELLRQLDLSPAQIGGVKGGLTRKIRRITGEPSTELWKFDARTDGDYDLYLARDEFADIFQRAVEIRSPE